MQPEDRCQSATYESIRKRVVTHVFANTSGQAGMDVGNLEGNGNGTEGEGKEQENDTSGHDWKDEYAAWYGYQPESSDSSGDLAAMKGGQGMSKGKGKGLL